MNFISYLTNVIYYTKVRIFIEKDEFYTLIFNKLCLISIVVKSYYKPNQAIRSLPNRMTLLSILQSCR